MTSRTSSLAGFPLIRTSRDSTSELDGRHGILNSTVRIGVALALGKCAA
jgi:hypothetical protein